MKLRLPAAARADLRSARRWYRSQGPGLDLRFLESIEQGLDRIREHVHLGRCVEGDVHRLLVRDFPYGIFYKLYPDEVIVIACLHVARDPRIGGSRSERD